MDTETEKELQKNWTKQYESTSLLVRNKPLAKVFLVSIGISSFEFISASIEAFFALSFSAFCSNIK